MPDPDPRAEAIFYLRWVRGAVGRFDGAEDPAPAGPALRGGARTAPTAPAAPRPPPGRDAGGGTGVAQAPLEEPALAATSPRAPDLVPLRPPGVAGSDVVPDELPALATTAASCRRCRLCETRTRVVFGEGPRHPRLLVIGEAPGADEDASGRPFVGKAGQLLTRMLAAIGLAREDVYIANVLKCRPPDNRTPAPDEVSACRPFLQEQIRLLDPALLLLLGTPATRAVLGTDRGITAVRGQLLRTPEGRPALATYHPAYLLRTPEAKREAWLDLQRVAVTLGLPVPGRPTGAEGPA